LGVEQFPERCVLSSGESWRSCPSPHEAASSLKPTIRSPGGCQNSMQLVRGRVDETSAVQLLLFEQCCIVWDEEHQQPVQPCRQISRTRSRSKSHKDTARFARIGQCGARCCLITLIGHRRRSLQ
jgi:hypothetical protein